MSAAERDFFDHRYGHLGGERVEKDRLVASAPWPLPYTDQWIAWVLRDDHYGTTVDPDPDTQAHLGLSFRVVD